MAFTNSPEFEDDFRKVGPDATAGFAPVGGPNSPTEHASSENLEVAGAADADDDLEDDEDLDEEEDDVDEDDLEDEEDDEDEDDLDEEDDEDLDDDDEDDEEDGDDEDLEEDDDTVKARLGAAEKRVRAA